ncbi:phage holin family protein [Nocardioides pinisoli]|uniref:Phage holin family protein n=1 Tax=Nocardioides pinisoli TaxID=2950279 RepID=A0ABT1KWV4_9ACTN|nr:phage holin family protein [Nocardioides pinisoli]MCP3422227.1 phage holin family protein [Nocardioides pinisoli]
MTGAQGFDAVPPAGATGPSGSHVVGTGTQDERSLGQIVGDLSHDLTTLVKQELELARTELKEEAAKAGKGAGMLGGAGIAGLLALILGSFALAYLLDNWMPVELAFLIVTLLWAIVGAVLAARGRKELKNANPQLPETQQTLKEDAAWARAQKN